MTTSKALATNAVLRETKKRRFLSIMAKENNRSVACKGAGIGRDTFYRWVKDGFITDDELTASYEKYRDNLRSELQKRALSGVQKGLFQNGKPVMQNGKQVMTTHYDNRLLALLVQKHLPEYREASDPLNALEQAELALPEHFIAFDYRLLYASERATVLAIAQATKGRELPMIGHNSPGGAYEAPYIDSESEASKVERQAHWYDNYHPSIGQDTPGTNNAFSHENDE